MARQLLPAGTGAGVTGIWVRVEGGFKRSVPMRISAIGSFAVDVITIEELIGGLLGTAPTPLIRRKLILEQQR